MSVSTVAMPTPERLAAIGGILFDKDGTLLDFNESWEPVNRAVALMAAGGDAVLAADLLRLCGMDPATGMIAPDSLFAAANTREIADAMIAAGARFELEILVARIDAEFAGAADQSVPVAALAPLFASLSARGLKLGIASSDNERSIRAIAARFGLDPYLDFVAGYDSGHGVKPEAGMVLAFCDATGLEPHQVAVVGDNNHDMHMGRNAGAGLTIAVLSGTGLRETLAAHSDLILDDVTGLPVLFG